LVGALIGGAIFNLFNIDFGLGDVAISLKDLISAFIGSLILLLVIWVARRRRKNKP
jgi:LPXTG-motif cell wall-anchored protein